jgi:hypothetical protein
MAITRFAGIPIPDWAGPLPGGGYEGLTKDLDDAVKAQAEWLAARYGDIVMRFNSDRWSGGAYLVDPLGSDAAVGLGASLHEGAVTYDVKVHHRLMRVEEGARSVDYGNGSPNYGFIACVDTAEAARDLLLAKLGEHVRLAQGAPLSPADIAVGDCAVLAREPTVERQAWVDSVGIDRYREFAGQEEGVTIVGADDLASVRLVCVWHNLIVPRFMIDHVWRGHVVHAVEHPKPQPARRRRRTR